MAFWRRLFGGASGTAKGDQISPRVAEIVEEVQRRKQLCVRLVPGEGGRSMLGGIPAISAAWPRFEGRPLSCVAQIDLEDVHAAGGPDWLPRRGRLNFFYECEHGGWGMEAADAGVAVVIYEAETTGLASEPEDLALDYRFSAYPVTFRTDVSFPGEDRIEIDWKGLNPASSSALESALDSLAAAEPTHQIGGFPTAIQNDDMELDCVRWVGGDVSEWRLLLQLDTDNDAGMMWGDTGMIYFWVREQNARAGDFSKIWMILQCH
jgi:uncharacterized protein YwqG